GATLAPAVEQRPADQGILEPAEVALLDETTARDAALAEEFGSSLEPTGLERHRLAWSHTLARRQSFQNSTICERPELAADLLVASYWDLG
ncbi:MAG: hypothetical protein GX621_10755, partial [Pirellulaceae bacterium]|nr:hypothetical protein [Pirellulaceae bacterium]